jgi:hypothetical protein
MRELKKLRDGMIAKGAKPASVNRDLKGLKAALTLYAASDPRITNANAWKVGLAALTDAHNAREANLTDAEVLALITTTYVEDAAISDLEADWPEGPRVQMPSSKKGKGTKRIVRYPVPIPAGLAAKLRAGGLHGALQRLAVGGAVEVPRPCRPPAAAAARTAAGRRA